jgi:hypothetical protein
MHHHHHHNHHHKEIVVVDEPTPTSSATSISTTCKAAATKRESIRMLIENKAVSENKQKDALEMHLSTILCTRTGLFKLNN